MRKNYGSLVYQIERLFDSGNAIGRSRHLAKRIGEADEEIFAIATIRDYIECFNRFAKYARQKHGVRFVGDLTPEIAREFINALGQQDRAAGTIGKYWSAIRKGDALMRRVGYKTKDAPPLLSGGFGRHGDPRPEPYSSQEATMLTEFLEKGTDPRFGQLAKLQRVAGLRVSEAINLRAEAIDETGKVIRLAHGDHTKGGRPREVPVSSEYAPFLLDLRALGLKHRDGRVFRDRKKLERPYQRALTQACKSLGIEHTRTHDFRATYANELYRRLLSEGYAEAEAQIRLAEALGHRRVQIRLHYLRDDFA